MTTRADLEREREALSEALSSNRIYLRGLSDADEIAYWQRQCDALTASIARLDALLSLSDEQAHDVAVMLRGLALDLPTGWARVDEDAVDADALRTVADLVRRAPGDPHAKCDHSIGLCPVNDFRRTP